eukprot:2510668-Amphidinium_carterae.2
MVSRVMITACKWSMLRAGAVTASEQAAKLDRAEGWLNAMIARGPARSQKPTRNVTLRNKSTAQNANLAT